MIVKNNPDYHFTASKQQYPSKPYFLQGLQYAKQLLLHIKKQKQSQSQIQYSPISRKHTKLSSDAIIQQYIQQNNVKDNQHKNKEKDKDRGGFGKNRKLKSQEIDSNGLFNNYCNESQQTTKIKYSDHHHHSSSMNNKSQDIQCIQHISVIQQQQHNEQSTQYYQQQTKHKNNTTQQQYQQQQQAQKKPNIIQSIKQTQKQINNIGQQLQQINTQLSVYQIVFDNLCDCYRANQAIYIKNNKLKKQALRLQQQKQDIIGKLAGLNKQFQQLDILEKEGNQYIGRSVENYVRELCAYNRQLKIQYQVNKQFNKESYSTEIDSQQEVYESKLNLNYKKMKDKYDQRTKKKVLMEPKKMQKGVSFQEQIDVMTKYFQSQLTNV